MDEKKYSTSRASQMLDVSPDTLKRWYKWYEDSSYKKPSGLKLPDYERDGRGTKFFSKNDIKELKSFKKKLQKEYRGCMARFNARYQWGKKGKQKLKAKEAKWVDDNQ